MPNWCVNQVHLTHEDPTMIARAIEGFEKGELLNTFIPCPEELNDTIKGFVGDKQDELEAQQARNIEKYGYPSWYEFKVAEWGTKWDIGGGYEGQLIRHDANYITLNFDSAWSPPIEAYAKLSELGFLVDAMYYEPGMGFCGRYTTDAGELTVNIVGDSEWVSENIDPDVVEAFNIAEQMAEWEAEYGEE